MFEFWHFLLNDLTTTYIFPKEKFYLYVSQGRKKFFSKIENIWFSLTTTPKEEMHPWEILVLMAIKS